MTKRTFSVCWAEAATHDLEEIIYYISLDSPLNAQKLLKKLEDKTKTLGISPERCRTVPELSRFGIRTYREMVIKPYRIIYRIAEKKVFILGVFDACRSLEDILLERLLRRNENIIKKESH